MAPRVLAGVSLSFLLCTPWQAWGMAPWTGITKAQVAKTDLKAIFGDVDAETTVADWYLYGMAWHPKSPKLAARWYLRAAKRGNTRAQVAIAELYEFGEAVPPDHEKALAWIRRAMVQDPGSARSIALRYQTGFNFHTGLQAPQNPQKAMDWYQMSAEAGDVRAQTTLGELYESGTGTQNFEEAARWYRAAAETYAPAMADLGHLYAMGEGVPQDYSEAVKLCSKATERDGSSGMYELGLLYEQGLGVPQNFNRAMELYHEVAAGNSDAKRRLFAIFEAGLPIPHDSDKAIAWYRAAADRGDPRAEVGLGLRYQFDEGVTAVWPVDREVAYALYNLAEQSPSPVRSNIPDFRGPANAARMYMSPDTWNLVHEMAEPGNVLKALDQYIARPRPDAGLY
jgi:TPR repeat protein